MNSVIEADILSKNSMGLSQMQNSAQNVSPRLLCPADVYNAFFEL